MTSTINKCSFGQNKSNKLLNPVNPISTVQKNGVYDISSLIQEIVTKDFKYTGSANFKLTLRNDKMVLFVEGKKSKLVAVNGNWSSSDTASRLSQTLDKIASAYQAYQPGPSSEKGKEDEASVEGKPAPAMNALIRSLQNEVEKLQRKVEAQDAPRVDNLKAAIEPINARIDSLQAQLAQLMQENFNLKELKEPLYALAKEVPQALREINESIRQIHLILERMGRSMPDSARILNTEEILRELKNIKNDSQELTNDVSKLQSENDHLRKENETLKATLALKDRKITDLEQQRKLLENTASTLRQKNEALEESREDLMRALEESRTQPVQDEAARERLKELEVAYAALQAYDKKREEAFEELTQRQETLLNENSHLDLANQKLGELQQEYSRLLEGVHLAKRVVEQDATRILELDKEKSDALAEIDRLKSHLSDAEKTNLVAQRTIAELNMTIKSQDSELQTTRQAKKEALAALDKTKQIAFTLRNDLEEANERHKEDDLNLAYMEEQRSRSAKEAAIAKRELKDLARQYEELLRTSNDLEKEHERTIKELEDMLHMQSNEQEKKGISDRLLQTQLEEKTKQLENEVKARQAIEAQIVLLKRSNKVLEEQITPPVKIDLTKAPPVPKATNIVIDANALVQEIKEMKAEKTIPEDRMGSMLVNRALLEEVTLDNLDEWMEKFPDLQKKKLIVRNQLNNQPKGSPAKEQTQVVIKGQIARANTEFADFMEKIKALPKPYTLNTIFGMNNAYIAHALLKYERTVEPLLEKCTIKGAEIEKSKQLLEIVRSLKAALREKLTVF